MPPESNGKRYETEGPFTGLWVRTARALRNGGYRSKDSVVSALRSGKLRAYASIPDYGIYAHREVLRWVARNDEGEPPLEIEALCEIALMSAGFLDAAHDVTHVRRVVATAKSLAAAENARLDVVIPAAWLHDCVTLSKKSPKHSRASTLSADQAAAWLRQWSYPAELISQIKHAIEAHSFSANITPRTLEARVVQDADRLDALGAIGLSRCLILGAQMGRPLLQAEDPFCERRKPDDSLSCVDHFYTKLLRLHETMQTDAGRAEAKRRTQFLRAYLEELAREVLPK